MLPIRRRPSPRGLPTAFLSALMLAGCADSAPTGIAGPAAAPRLIEAASATDVNISQVYGGGGNSGATLTNDFIELYNAGTTPIDLAGWSVQYASAAGVTWQFTALSGTIAPGSYYLVQQAKGTAGTQALPTPDATGNIAMSGTAGKVALVNVATALSGACPAGAQIIDLVGFGTTANCSEGNLPTGNLSNTTAALRKGAGSVDTEVTRADFDIAAPDPRNSSMGLLSVASTTPASGASGVALNANIEVTFSRPATVTGSWFEITCTSSGAHAATATAGPTVYTLDPADDLAAGESCTVKVLADGVTDQNTPPRKLAADYSWSFTAGAGGDQCAAEFTPTYAIQGREAATPLLGQTVSTKGVVVGDYEGPSPALRGFYLQDLEGDNDPATSDALFVFNGTNDAVKVGDVVRVTGQATEFQEQTQIANVTSVTSCGTAATATPADIALPVASATYLERFEGMLVRLPQKLFVTELFQLGRFGEIVMSSGSRLSQPTSVAAPGGAAQAVQAGNDLNRITIDDADNGQNADPIVFGRGGNPLSASNTLRGGDAATGIVGVLTYTWAGNSASGNAYRVRPVNALGGAVPAFEATNPRPSAPPSVGGTLKVVALNLLNYFNTFSGCTGGVGGAGMDCRGADNAAEFERQWPKTVAAIMAMDADVVGINEIENDGYGSGSAIADVVSRLNAATAPGTYAFVDADAATGQTNALGTDAIKVGLIYKPARVTPVGTTAALNSIAFVNGGDPAPRSRPALAQAFEQGNRARFVVTVNHLKSKGSGCSVPDARDGQGNCNVVRTNAANELLRWLATDPTGTGDPDVLIMGDLNSYAKEDPITALTAGGFTNLVEAKLGADAYSYAFDGQWGYLDYALASASLTERVTGVAEWHINADEPTVLDYNTNFKTPAQIASLYATDQFRVSDHDPVIVGLDLPAGPVPNRAPTAAAGGPYTATEGAAVAFSGAGSTDPDDDALSYEWSFGDEGSATGVSPTHSYTQDGSYTVQLVVTDARGLTNTTTTTATITNVAPVIAAFAGATGLLPGESYSTTGSFADPGADSPWRATARYGDGSAAEQLTLSGKSFALSHAYAAPGTFTVTVEVADDDATSTRTATVAVLTIAAGIDNALALVDRLAADRRLSSGNAAALRAKLLAARASVGRGDTRAALTELRSVVTELDSFVANRRLTSADAAPLRAYVSRIIESLSR